MKKRGIAIVLAFSMALQLAPLPEGMLAGFFDTFNTSEAAETLGQLSGTDGNISWQLVEETPGGGVTENSGKAYRLTISGTGEMKNYGTTSYKDSKGNTVYKTDAPWSDYALEIQTIDVQNGITNISSNAFYGCTAVTSVTIPEGVTNIGNNAFCKCFALKSITLPSGLETIGYSAFKYCTDMPKINIPSNVSSMGSYAFGYCKKLEEVSIPGSLGSIPDSAFYYCSGLKNVTISEGIKKIGSYAFYSCESLKTVTLPDKLTTIEMYAFVFCNYLTTVTLPDTLITIGNSAFKYCDALKEITLHEGLETIGTDAFSNTGLTKLDIPASVTDINGNPCVDTNLTTITVEDGNKNYIVEDNLLIELKDNEKYKAVCYPTKASEEAKVPDPVQVIGSSAFKQTEITQVTLPGSLTEISSRAFEQCTQMTSISIPGNVETIGSSAFSYCYALNSINLGAGITKIEDYAFYNCTELSGIKLPDAITSIGGYAFQYCSKLQEVRLPNTVTQIGSSVFSNCSSLEKIDIGQKLQSITGDVFVGCPKLSNISISSRNPYIMVEDNVVYDKDKTTLIYYAAGLSNDKFLVPDTVTAIGSYAFTYATELKELRLPKTVTTLKRYAIYHNEQLSKILFYGNAPAIDIDTSYTSSNLGNTYTYTVYNASIYNNSTVKGSGKYDNSGMTIHTIENAAGYDKGWKQLPDGYTDKTENGYIYKYKWQKMAEFLIWDPDKTDTAEGEFGDLKWTYRDDIGELAFTGSGKTPDYTMDNLPSWAAEADDGQSLNHMKDIQLVDTTGAESVKLGSYVFYGASKLVRLNSGAELKSIGESAFAACDNLKILAIQDTPVIGKSAFEGDKTLGNTEDAKAVDLRGAVTIGEAAFKDCSALTEVLLGNSLTGLAKQSFMGCEALSNIILPEKLTEIPEQCFSGCNALRTINIPKAVKAIGKECFANSSAFEKIYFYGDYPESWKDDSLDNCNSDLKIYYRSGNESWKTNIKDDKWNNIPVQALDKFYTADKDGYSFANTRSSFGYGAPYFIPRQRYVTATQSITRGSYYYAWSSEWGGSCFGMAASTTEFYEGNQFDIADYTAGAQSLYDVKSPGNPNADLTKIIEIYQVSQYAEEISDEIGANYGKYKKLVKQVEEFERSGGLTIDSKADPVVLCVYSAFAGHALVPVSVNIDSDGNYIMEVYDCNYPGILRTLTVKKDFSKIEYNGGFINYTSASFVRYSTIRDALEKADFIGESLKNESKASSEESARVTVAVNSENVSIVNNGDRDYTEIEGAYEQRHMSDVNGDTFSGIRSFVLPVGQYTIKDTSDNTQTKKAKASDDDSLTYYVATGDLYSKVETTSDDAQLKVKSVEGSGSDAVTVESDNKDNVSEITIVNKEGDESTIAVKGSSVTANVTAKNTINIKVSEDTTELKVNDEEVDVSEIKEIKDVEFKEIKTHNVTVSAGEGISEVTGTNEYKEGDTYTISATVKEGYVWKCWDDGDTNQTRTIKMGAEDKHYTALAEKAPISAPTENPTVSPDVQPTMAPTENPTVSPSVQPTSKPITGIIIYPSREPGVQPTATPTVQPTSVPTTQPTATPGATPTVQPTLVPTTQPTVMPVTEPTAQPSGDNDDYDKGGTSSDVPDKGLVVKKGAAKYVITKVSGKNKTVAFNQLSNKSAKKVTIPNQIKIDGKVYKVTAIGKNAFKDAKKLKEVILGSNIQSIGDAAFINCKKLESVKISKKVNKIGKNVFKGCANLETLVINSDKITSVGKNAFKGVKANVTVKASKKSLKKYSKMFVSKGKMPKKASFVTSTVK